MTIFAGVKSQFLRKIRYATKKGVKVQKYPSTAKSTKTLCTPAIELEKDGFIPSGSCSGTAVPSD
jgi:hypothetical protein